jgi:cytochrome c biogenesis protein
LGSLSLVTETTNNLNIVINDLSNKIYIYDSKGELLQESNTGGFVITSQKLNFQIFDFITSTGLQIKFDPGISTVYFSFLLLIISIYVSFFSYSQIWFVELLKSIKMGGSSNRAVLFFQENFKKVVKTSIKI